MKRILLLCIFGMAAALPCRSQDVILLREGGEPLTGRVLWDESRGDSLFYRRANGAGDTLLLFIPRRRVEYVLNSDDCRMMYRGRGKGWQPWRGRTFHEVPQQRMLYGTAWSTILGGWSADASVLRMMNRNHRVGVGASVRYLSTRPSRDDRYRIVTYDHRAVAFGPQVEIRGYSRRLRTFFYVDVEIGGCYHRFEWAGDYDAKLDWLGTYVKREELERQYPSSRWAYQFNYRFGAYVRLTRGLYADVAFTGIGHIITRIPQKYVSSDQFPFGFSAGLRFGRERRH